MAEQASPNSPTQPSSPPVSPSEGDTASTSGLRSPTSDGPPKAYVLGYTGAVGAELVKELVKSRSFSQVILIGRRRVEYQETELQQLEQREVNFENLEAHGKAFEDIPVGFCCMGTTKAKAGSAEMFKRIDFDYVRKSAEVSKAQGCKSFHLVTSYGANKKSSLLYLSTKGALEEAIENLSFERLAIYRPKMLLGTRAESRPGEKFFSYLLKPIVFLSPTGVGVSFESVAQAMVYNALHPPAPSTPGEARKPEGIDNTTLHKYAKLLQEEQARGAKEATPQ